MTALDAGRDRLPARVRRHARRGGGRWGKRGRCQRRHLRRRAGQRTAEQSRGQQQHRQPAPRRNGGLAHRRRCSSSAPWRAPFHQAGGERAFRALPPPGSGDGDAFGLLGRPRRTVRHGRGSRGWRGRVVPGRGRLRTRTALGVHQSPEPLRASSGLGGRGSAARQATPTRSTSRGRSPDAAPRRPTVTGAARPAQYDQSGCAARSWSGYAERIARPVRQRPPAVVRAMDSNRASGSLTSAASRRYSSE